MAQRRAMEVDDAKKSLMVLYIYIYILVHALCAARRLTQDKPTADEKQTRQSRRALGILGSICHRLSGHVSRSSVGASGESRAGLCIAAVNELTANGYLCQGTRE